MSTIDVASSAEEKPVNRRSYLGWLIGLCAAGAGAVLSVPLIRFALYPLRIQTTKTKWSDAGAASDFTSITSPVQRSITVEQVDGWRKTLAEKVVYVSKSPAGHLEVFSAVCPHLGCSVQWRSSKHEFECPCHAAAFGADGSRLGGPAPRSMDSLETQIQDGRLMVRYQYFRQLVPTKEVIG